MYQSETAISSLIPTELIGESICKSPHRRPSSTTEPERSTRAGFHAKPAKQRFEFYSALTISIPAPTPDYVMMHFDLLLGPVYVHEDGSAEYNMMIEQRNNVIFSYARL
jgi:hypothetical protein